MKRPLDPKRPAPVLGSIHRGEVLPVVEAARRLGWNRASIVNAQRGGLKMARIGRFNVTTGEAIFAYVEKMMQAAAGDEQSSGEGGKQ